MMNIPSVTSSPSVQSVQQERLEAQPTTTWHKIALGAIFVLAACLNFVQVQLNGYGNTYYAAAVKSMLLNWHNFFFASFDPGGFVTVDKPPLGLWIETLSAKIFGFSGFSLLLPQALAGLFSVLLIYHLVRRNFGPSAGLIAALVLAITPITVVMSRDNNQDMMLVFLLLLAAWWAMLATERGSLRWLALSMLAIGLAFNIKTLEAYLIVPAIYLLYLLGAPGSWRKRIIHLILAGLVLCVISFSWSVAVDLTPASQRPYVGSSQTNSEIELTFGYNGLERLTGMGSLKTGSTEQSEASRTSSSTQMSGFTMSEGGSPSIFRLFTADLGGQVSWLLPLALFTLLAMAWQARWRIPLSRWHQALLFWGIWVATTGAFFSVASFFHSYYLVIIAPAIAALTGIGLTVMWREYRTYPVSDWRGWLLPGALLLTAAEQVYILTSYAMWKSILTPVILIACLIAALALIFAKLPRFTVRFARIPFPAVTVAMLALLLTPLLWSIISTTKANDPTIPTAGPMLTSGNSRFAGFPGANGEGLPASLKDLGDLPGGAFPGGSGFMMGEMGSSVMQVDSKLLKYLEDQQGSTRYLVAMQSATLAAPYIIQTGKPVMAMGGFLGSDPILTAPKVATLVKSNQIRFFYISSASSTQMPSFLSPEQRAAIEELMGGSGGSLMGMGNSEVNTWIQHNCTVVPGSAWGDASSTQSAGAAGLGMNNQLYDCAPTR